MSNRPTAIDLFAGAGGMSLGFEQAGFDILAAVEIDPIHAATHHFNFPHAKTLARSVVGLDAEGIIEKCRESAGECSVDVVFGGAPCQGFSLIGHRMLDDPRNHLVGQFVRLVVELQPRYFVFENVKGLTIGRHRKFLGALISEFQKQGYRVLQKWKVLNAVNYGVPQCRERLFLFGARDGCRLPEYPEPTTSPETDLFSASSVQPSPTCLEALGDIPDVSDFDELAYVDSAHVNDWRPASAFAQEMHCMIPGCWHFGYPRSWDPLLLTSSMRTAHTEISRRRFRETPHGSVEPVSRFYKLSPGGQSNTLRAGTDSARGAFTSPRPIHYLHDRCVTVREMARLHGYPDWFRFHVTKWHGARQIGNSVPPPLARAVASSVMRALGLSPVRPDRTLELGDPALLSMDMTKAANFWDVPVPIQKRDRKNGLRKRKQHEIESERHAV